MIAWASDFFATVHGFDKARASAALGVFMIAMISGRVVGSRLARGMGLFVLIAASVAVALGGFFLFWLGGSASSALAGLFMTGLGISGLYPFLLALAIGSAGDQRVRASAVATLASGAAIMTLPLLLGRIADTFGIRDAYIVIPFVLVALAVIAIAAKGGSKRESAA